MLVKLFIALLSFSYVQSDGQNREVCCIYYEILTDHLFSLKNNRDL